MNRASGGRKRKGVRRWLCGEGDQRKAVGGWDGGRLRGLNGG